MLTTTMRALVVEDGSKMAALLRRGLQEEGFAVDVAANGEDGSWLGAENDYDVILLDVMLPDVDGFEVCRRLWAGDRWAPILMLTARDGIQDRVAGLDAGADDDLMKPPPTVSRSASTTAASSTLLCMRTSTSSVTCPMTRAPQARKAQPTRTAGTRTDGSAPDRLSRRHPDLATAYSLATRPSTGDC
jgi:CheY-like chemotaxis protein